MINPKDVVFWWPAGLKKFKEVLFAKVAANIQSQGGKVVKGDERRLIDMADDGCVPVVGCHVPLRDAITEWRLNNKPWIYWDRGYCARWFATCLPQPASMEQSYYRWHCGGFQIKQIRDVPDDRWKRLKLEVTPWRKNGRHVVIAANTETYSKLHGCEDWLGKTVTALAKVTDRQLVVRDKEQFRRRPLQKDLEGAHCLVTHGSNAANEAIILGTPVFCDKSCAAALVGLTDLAQIERPIYPDREPWLHSLAYSQFTEPELIDGTLWKLIA